MINFTVEKWTVLNVQRCLGADPKGKGCAGRWFLCARMWGRTRADWKGSSMKSNAADDLNAAWLREQTAFQTGPWVPTAASPHLLTSPGEPASERSVEVLEPEASSFPFSTVYTRQPIGTAVNVEFVIRRTLVAAALQRTLGTQWAVSTK